MILIFALLLNSSTWAATDSNCLSAQEIQNYSRSAAVKKMLASSPTPALKTKIKAGFSLRAVREALEKNGLVKTLIPLDPSTERGGETDNLKAAVNPSDQTASDTGDVRALNARDANLWLTSNGFVNLSTCPEWKKTLVDPKKVPAGAVVIYRHPRQDTHPGHIEIATSSGFWSDLPRAKREYSAGLDVVGVYVKPVE